MMEKIKPILKKYGALKDESFIHLQTSSLTAKFAATASPEIAGCHWQFVHGTDGSGNPTLEKKWLCPGDNDFDPNA